MSSPDSGSNDPAEKTSGMAESVGLKTGKNKEIEELVEPEVSRKFTSMPSTWSTVSNPIPVNPVTNSKESVSEVKRELQDLLKQYAEISSPGDGSAEVAEIELERRKLQNLRDLIAGTKASGSPANSGPGLPSSLPNTVAMALAKDVEKMIEKAKRDSEIKVKSELARIRKEIITLSDHVAKLQTVSSKAAATKADETTGKGKSPSSESIVDKRTLTEFVQKVETRWLSEMNILKQELHQTILAHNHNADLMKHLKDAMDHIRIQLDERNLLRPDQWIRWMPRVEQFLSQSSQRDRQLQAIIPKADSLLLRVEALESQILSINPGAQAQFAHPHSANSYLMGAGGRQHAWVEDRAGNDAGAAPASQARVGPGGGDARGPGVGSQGVAKDRKQDQEGSERSGTKPQRKSGIFGNSPDGANQPNSAGASRPMPDPKLDGVGAPPGLPPPPGLTQF